MTPHPDSDLIAAYVERRLPTTERAEVEAHLAECADCRLDAIAVASTLETTPRRYLARAAPWLAAAAVLALVVVTNPFARPTDADRMRPGGDLDALPGITAIFPESSAVVARSQLRFVWGSDGPGARYEFRLTDASGALLWQATTADTVAMPPDSLRLAGGGTYLWWVDVLLPDGRLARTPLREFTLGP